MKSILIGFMLVFVLSPVVHASKSSQIAQEIKKNCNKKITSRTAMKLVKKSFLLCRPGSKIVIESGCSIPCLKSNKGSVIGAESVASEASNDKK